MTHLKLAAAAALAMSAVALPAAAQTTVDWTFAGQTTPAPLVNSGQLTYDANDVITSFSGSYNGQSLSLVTFTSDPNNPNAQLGPADGQPAGVYNYHGIPNTGGADLTFDNVFPIDALAGVLVSTGTGANERVYNLFSNGAGITDFFSINPDGSYRQDNGVFETTAAAVPESATWAMMILGMGAVGFAMRRRVRRSEDAFDAKIKAMTANAEA